MTRLLHTFALAALILLSLDARLGGVFADDLTDCQEGSGDTVSKELDLTFWNSIKDTDDPDMLQAYLDQFPKGTFAALVKIMLGKLKKAQ